MALTNARSSVAKLRNSASRSKPILTLSRNRSGTRAHGKAARTRRPNVSGWRNAEFFGSIAFSPRTHVPAQRFGSLFRRHSSIARTSSGTSRRVRHTCAVTVPLCANAMSPQIRQSPTHQLSPLRRARSVQAPALYNVRSLILTSTRLRRRLSVVATNTSVAGSHAARGSHLSVPTVRTCTVERKLRRVFVATFGTTTTTAAVTCNAYSATNEVSNCTNGNTYAEMCTCDVASVVT